MQTTVLSQMKPCFSFSLICPEHKSDTLAAYRQAMHRLCSGTDAVEAEGCLP